MVIHAEGALNYYGCWQRRKPFECNQWGLKQVLLLCLLLHMTFTCVQNVNAKNATRAQYKILAWIFCMPNTSHTQVHITPVNQTLAGKKTILACLARLHGVLLLCTRLANDRPLSSSQAVCPEYELMHCNMTVIIPLGEPTVLQGPFSFSFESKVSQLPLSALSYLFSSLTFTLFFPPLLLFPFLSMPFNSYTNISLEIV